MTGPTCVSHSEITSCPLVSGPLCLRCCGWFWDRHQSFVHWVAEPPPCPLQFCTDTSLAAQGTSLPWAFGHRNRDSFSFTASISTARSPAGAECLRNLGCVAAVMVHPSPQGDHPPRIMACAPAQELELSTPQTGIMDPTAPLWEGCGGSGVATTAWLPTHLQQQPGRHQRPFSYFLTTPYIHPKELWHWHWREERHEDNGTKGGHLPLMPSSYPCWLRGEHLVNRAGDEM